MPINPGQLDRRITFQNLVETRGVAGGVRTAWADVRTVYASKIEQGSTEFVAAGQLKAETTVIFRCRWWPELTGKHRIVCEGKVYDIVLPNEEGRREMWRIQARGAEAPK